MEEANQKRRDRVIRNVSRTIAEAVIRGTDAAENATESIKETIRSRPGPERQTRNNVVMVRVDRDSLERMDELVEVELAGSRSEAAALLISAGIEARKDLFASIYAKVAEIRKAKEELKAMLNIQEEAQGPQDPIA